VIDGLRVRRLRFAVVFGVGLGRFRSVVRSVLMMTVSKMSMVGSRFVLAIFVVLGGFLVVACCVFVMLCCLLMMICDVLRHSSLL
jgi:uncharacterized membrane protein YidH (DUF202 family)